METLLYVFAATFTGVVITLMAYVIGRRDERRAYEQMLEDNKVAVIHTKKTQVKCGPRLY